MTRRLPTACVLLTALVLCTGLAGCRSAGESRSFTFQPAEYDAALDATRDVLRGAGYTIERVDAVRGEILTAPKTNAGLVTPFEPEYEGLGELWEDTLNNQPRTVRVRFRDAESVRRGSPAPPTATGEILAEVDAVVWRTRRPGWRLETEFINLSRSSLDPQLAERGVTGGMLVPVGRDDAFAARLAARVHEKTRGLAAGRSVDNEQDADAPAGDG